MFSFPSGGVQVFVPLFPSVTLYFLQGRFIYLPAFRLPDLLPHCCFDGRHYVPLFSRFFFLKFVVTDWCLQLRPLGVTGLTPPFVFFGRVFFFFRSFFLPLAVLLFRSYGEFPVPRLVCFPLQKLETGMFFPPRVRTVTG